MTPVLSSLTIPQLYQLLLDGDEVERATLLDWFEETQGNRQGWEWLAREDRFPEYATHYKRMFHWTRWNSPNYTEDIGHNLFLRLKPEVLTIYCAYYPTLESALTDAARAAQQAIDAKGIE